MSVPDRDPEIRGGGGGGERSSRPLEKWGSCLHLWQPRSQGSPLPVPAAKTENLENKLRLWLTEFILRKYRQVCDC